MLSDNAIIKLIVQTRRELMKLTKKKSNIPIPIIDLFAGPGGLGEGFSSITDENGNRVFRIKLSIEKDEDAHRTLQLRSFFRQFPIGKAPEEYYDFIKKYTPRKDQIERAKLFDKFPDEAKNAINESWLCELGDTKFPPELVDKRISTAIGNSKNWVLIGGPPCQAYSVIGRSRNKGINKEDPRVFLYQEYLRIIAVHHPAVFVMENVKGLLSAKLEGNKIFDLIKADLKDPRRLFPGHNTPKYRLYSLIKSPDGFIGDDPVYTNDKDFLIKTEKFGVPQNRHRVILLGIREDFGKVEYNPLEIKKPINLEDVIGALPKLRSGIGREVAGTNIKGNNSYRKIKDSNTTWRTIIDEFIKKVGQEFKGEKISFNSSTGLTKGENFNQFVDEEPNNSLKNWFYDPHLDGILNHETRSHLKEDLGRYLFSSLYLRLNNDFPKLKDYPEWLLPNHKNAKGGKFADRFRTQRPNQPATTVTSHISKDGHYFIHYDPLQCRSLTVREAARIQTFPDNYFFCGARTQQFHQVGNAVPPFLANQIGRIVRDLF